MSEIRDDILKVGISIVVLEDRRIGLYVRGGLIDKNGNAFKSIRQITPIDGRKRAIYPIRSVYEIIDIEQPYDLKTLFELDPKHVKLIWGCDEYREVTMKEIERMMGTKVKIVGDFEIIKREE